MGRHAPDVPAALAVADRESLLAVVRQLASHAGIRRVRLVPVALTGTADGLDLAALVDAVRQDCPELGVVVAAALGSHPQVQDAMVSAVVDMLETRH
jgi:sirohydrochlorin ferrochelatase